VSSLYDLSNLDFLPPKPILELVHANGKKLYMGITVEGNYVEYIDTSLDLPYILSTGDPTADDDEIIEFQMGKDHHVTEIYKAYTVSFEDLVFAAIEFLHSGTRPIDAITRKEE
jgi:hypothetical protein